MDMPVNLDPATEQVVHDLVESGAYKSREAVVMDGVRMVEARQAGIRNSIREGIADIEAGRHRNLADVFDDLIAEVEQMVASK